MLTGGFADYPHGHIKAHCRLESIEGNSEQLMLHASPTLYSGAVELLVLPFHPTPIHNSQVNDAERIVDEAIQSWVTFRHMTIVETQ